MKNLHVAVLMGGTSTEREVSLRSGSAVARALTATGAHVTSVDVRGPNFNLPASVDVAFIALHGAFGEDGQMQRLLELRGVPYTGSDVEASARAFDKIAAKRAFTVAKVRTPRYTVIEKSRPDTSALRKWKLPLVVKPSRQGSSVGVSIVRKREELADALAQAWQHDEQVIVEDFIADPGLRPWRFGRADAGRSATDDRRPRAGGSRGTAERTAHEGGAGCLPPRHRAG